MVLFFMSNTDYNEILSTISKNSELVAQRRGEHAAALWSVNNFLSDLGDGLIAYRDTKSLAEQQGVLLIAPHEAPNAAPDSDAKPPWGLFIETKDERVLAYEASPVLVVAAVRRLAEFLAGFSKQLQNAAGSEHTLSQAKRFVTAACASA